MIPPISQDAKKLVTLLALETSALVAWFSGAGSLLTWRVFGAALELLGPGPVQWLTEPLLSYRVLDRGYHIAYWCTPTSIWTGGFLLIWAGAPTWSTQLARSALYAACTFAALALNLVLSVWLHPHVPGWYWGHIPGTVIIYVAAFVTCLAWISRAPQGAPRRDPHARIRRRVLQPPPPVPATSG